MQPAPCQPSARPAAPQAQRPPRRPPCSHPSTVPGGGARGQARAGGQLCASSRPSSSLSCGPHTPRTPRQGQAAAHGTRWVLQAPPPPSLQDIPQPQLYASCAGSCPLPQPRFSRVPWEVPPQGPAGRKAQAPNWTPAPRAGRLFLPKRFPRSRGGAVVQPACGLTTQELQDPGLTGNSVGEASNALQRGGARQRPAGTWVWPRLGWERLQRKPWAQQLQGLTAGLVRAKGGSHLGPRAQAGPQSQVARQGGRRWAVGRGSELEAPS